jgi:hypothetical protein
LLNPFSIINRAIVKNGSLNVLVNKTILDKSKNVMTKEMIRQILCHCYFVNNHSYSSVQEIIKNPFKKRMGRKGVETLGSQNYPGTGIPCDRINADRFSPNRFNTTDLLILQINCFDSKLTCSL